MGDAGEKLKVKKTGEVEGQGDWDWIRVVKAGGGKFTLHVRCEAREGHARRHSSISEAQATFRACALCTRRETQPRSEFVLSQTASAALADAPGELLLVVEHTQQALADEQVAVEESSLDHDVAAANEDAGEPEPATKYRGL
eukprot:6190984-Pleurochrysis_carterae.AAC.4